MADAAAVEGRLKLMRQAFVLEYLTLAWMVIEAGVAIGCWMEPLDGSGATVLVAGPAGEPDRDPVDVGSFAAQTAPCRRAREPGAARRAVESIACGWLSFVVVIGLLAQLVLGAWWINSVTSLVIVWLLVKEGREAWSAEEDDD